MADISAIKSRINCIDYCRRKNLPIHKPGDRCVSPLRPDATHKNNFVIYPDFFYDFVSRQGGDVIDLCAALDHDGDRGAAIRELSALTGVQPENTNWVRHTKNLNSLIQRWHESLRPEDRDYLHSRRITDETITRLKIGYTDRGITYVKSNGESVAHFAKNRISIPYWKNGYVCSWIARATQPGQEPKYIKRPNDDYSDKSAPWGLQSIHDAPELIIAEGTFDALSFEQENYPVLATMGGHFSPAQLKTVLSIAKTFPRVFVCFDADDAGSGFALKLAQSLFQHRIPFVTGKLPPPYKDVSEYYEAGGDLQSLIDNATNGLIGLCQHITDKTEFKTFAFRAARFVGKPELVELFNAARDNFPPDWLAEVRKAAMNPPSEDAIARDVEGKHQLLYRENVGFYEYSRGCWRFKEDTEIQAYIGAELGHYRTGSRLNSIIRLIRTDVITSEEFDKKRIFNFVNGTLELDTGVFRDHTPDDLCSIQVNYPYDKSARSEQWERFIDQICNYDQMRAALLQEMAGYVLFPDCSLEKIFVLTGEGGNGKSKFLEILKATFGEENCSSVTASGLCADFQRINLSKSLLNIAQEIKSDLSGSEEYLKQIASGETISACYKGKNFIDFKPRCKMIFGCNGQLQSKDTSKGLERRMCIVNFECKFVDDPNPDNPNEYQKDVNLVDKLMNDLPAVFNWAMQGYSQIAAVKKFSEPEDQTKLLEDFREASNPVITFVKEWGYSGAAAGGPKDPWAYRITSERLYEEYRNWCVEAGHMAKSRRGFLREFNKVKPKSIVYVDTYAGGEKFRGYQIYKNQAETLPEWVQDRLPL